MSWEANDAMNSSGVGIVSSLVDVTSILKKLKGCMLNTQPIFITQPAYYMSNFPYIIKGKSLVATNLIFKFYFLFETF